MGGGTVENVGNPWMERRVLAYAHRGGAREAPSNTIQAMRRALAVGATALEMDVHPTSDGHLVVCHDPMVDRTTNGSGATGNPSVRAVRVRENNFSMTTLPMMKDHCPLFVVEPSRALEGFCSCSA